MAQSKNNIITHGLSGMVGDQLVFRQHDGKTIVSRAPRRSDRPHTPAQQAHLSRFQQAVAYGKSVMADPFLKEFYTGAGTGQNAFNNAVSDFYHAPEIEDVDPSGYTGTIGSVIKVRATDDFAVTAVTVRIEAADGTLLEEGPAVPVPGTTTYRYTATRNNTTTAGGSIVVTASDRAGNRTRQTCVP